MGQTATPQLTHALSDVRNPHTSPRKGTRDRPSQSETHSHQGPTDVTLTWSRAMHTARRAVRQPRRRALPFKTGGQPEG